MKLPIIIDHLRNALETHQFGALADERADLFNRLQQEQRDVLLPALFHAEQDIETICLPRRNSQCHYDV